MIEEIISIPKTSIENTEIVGKLGNIFLGLAKENNFDDGFGLIRELDARGRAFDRAKSIGLDILERAWIPEKHEGESFLAAAVRQTPLSAITIRNHIAIQRLLDSERIPDQYYEGIEQAGAKSLIQIAHVSESHDLEDKDWLAFSEASGDERKVGMIARKIKKVKPRSNFRGFTVDEHGGVFFHKGGSSVEIGKMYINSSDKLVQEGIDCANVRMHTLPVVEY